MQKFHSGFMTLIGRPNVGKSTLMNQVLRQKIAIMSNKPQTTRNKIQGIYTDDESQIIFIDTPGVHKPKNELDLYMLKMAYRSLEEVDAIIMLVAADEVMGAGDQFIIEKIKKFTCPKFLIVNKIDKVSKDELANYISNIPEANIFADIFLISAITREGLDDVLSKLKAILPEGPMYYPADQVSDHPEYFIVGELVREQILHLTREEVPHSVAVVVTDMSFDNRGIVHIMADIVVERNSQKGIIIGKKGQMLKEIGQKARREIEHLLGTRCYLELFVKVEKNWRDRQAQLHQLGYQEKLDI